MTTQTTVPQSQGPRMPSRMGAGDDKSVPFARLVKVELRKLVDTRAGRILLAVIVALLVGVSLIVMFAGGSSEPKSVNDFVQVGTMVLQTMLPIIGILAVTSEWSQRTGLVTFTLEPRRGRVALAKWAASLLMGLAGALIGFAIAIGFGALTSVVPGSEVTWDIGGQLVLGVFIGQLLNISMGVAFGMLIQTTPGAIVAFLLLPTLWSALGSISWMEQVAKWLDTGRTIAPLYDGSVEGSDWPRLGVSLLVWLVLPMVLGIWRMVRSEVKSA